MNIFKVSTAVLSTCALSVGLTVGVVSEARADYQSFSLAPGFQPDPQVGTGHSGGDRVTSDCGNVDTASAPDHVVYLSTNFSFLRAAVNSPGDVTLLVEGPGGRICSDDVNGLMPEISGSWSAGTYNVWIGDWDGGYHRYELSLSEF